ncbi:MAG: signal peptidase [Frankiales bacterium]|nr:signal peptidase [Frankiales bacterium]
MSSTDDAPPAVADEPLAEPGEAAGRPSRTPAWLEFPILVVIAVGLAVLIKTFLLQAFYIPSPSMEQTLHGCDGCRGDRILVNKIVYHLRGIHRGDIVVFDGKDNYSSDSTPQYVASNPVSGALHTLVDFVGLAPAGTDYVKRVIGLPGDKVQCCDSLGRVMVNGVPLDEPYVYQDDHHTFGPVTVPKGRLWVMGDHRSASDDSRYVGAVPESDVIGRAFVTIWPPSRWRWLSPQTYHGVPAAVTSATPMLLAAAVVGPVGLARRRRRRRRPQHLPL